MKYFIFLFFILLSIHTHAQFNSGDADGAALLDSRFQDLLADLVNDVRKYNLTHYEKNTKGSPYYNDRFVKGTILQNDKAVSNRLFFRYNAYADEIEMGTHPDQKEAKEAVIKKNDIVCKFGDQTYYYLPFLNKNKKVSLGYLIPLYESDQLKLLLQIKKVYREATIPRTSLERGFPPRFIEEKNYYLSIDEQTPNYLGNDPKKLAKNLPLELKSKFKAKGINTKKIRDIDALKASFTILE